MSRTGSSTAVAILAKAPVPGFAKTRLIPVVGAHAAAVLHERLTERAVETAIEAAVGPVTLWAAPNETHRMFREFVARFPLTLARQPEGDLGARILAAAQVAAGPVLIIGADCPALSAAHLRAAAQALASADVTLIPAADGGYVLIGMRTPILPLFSEMPWSSDRVLAETRARIASLGLTAHEQPALWDIDDADDLERLEREHPDLAL